MCGAAFFLVAAVLQCVWVNGAMLTTNDEEIVREEATPYRRQVIKLAEIVWMGALVLTAALVPLIIYPNDPAHSGMTASYFEEYVLIYGGVGLFIGTVILWLVNGSLVKRSILVPEDKGRHFRNRTLLGIRRSINATKDSQSWNSVYAASFVTFQPLRTTVSAKKVSATATAKPATQRFSKSWRGDRTAPTVEIGEEAPQRVPGGGLENVDELPQYYDEYGTPISEEEALREELLDRDGNVLCTYLHRNESVVHWESGKDKMVIW